MATAFRYVRDRDLWERHTGETAEEHDWFQHWLHDSHRRSYPRTADQFGVKRDKIARTARRNCWAERLDGWKRHQSARVQERFEDMVEQSLVPFAQAMARLALHATQAPTDEVSADKALVAATGAMRVIKEPSVRDLIRAGQGDGDGREFAALDVVLNRLERTDPAAYEAALDALEHPDTPDGTEGGV